MTQELFVKQQLEVVHHGRELAQSHVGLHPRSWQLACPGHAVERAAPRCVPRRDLQPARMEESDPVNFWTPCRLEIGKELRRGFAGGSQLIVARKETVSG